MNIKTPVVILTGFLGSGKTTVLNYVLNADHGKRIAVVQNEFGAVNLDSGFTSEKATDIVELSNGCLCCALHEDLAGILMQLRSADRPMDAILIETSGLADPAPILQTILLHPLLQEHFRAVGIVTLADAVNLEFQLQHAGEAQKQLAMADAVVLSKKDLITQKEEETVLQRLRSINPVAVLSEAANGAVDAAWILSAGGRNERLFNHESERRESGTHHHHDSHHHHEHTQVSSVSIDEPGSVNLQKFDAWIQALMMFQGENLWRMKGLLSVADEPRRVEFHCVHGLMMARPGGAWNGEPRRTQFVFIGKNLDKVALKAGMLACMEESDVSLEAGLP